MDDGQLPGGGGGGKVERLYFPTAAADVMQNNPGHYVALVILRDDKAASSGDAGGGKVTRVKLLKPEDTLHLGQLYRLIAAQEVTTALQARKKDKMRRRCEAMHDQLRRGDPAKQVSASPPPSRRSTTGGAQPGRGRHWRPSLQSISEAGSAS